MNKATWIRPCPICSLPSEADVLFSTGGLRDIAYGELLHSGELTRGSSSFPGEWTSAWPSVRTVNRSYHHHSDMALAYCLPYQGLPGEDNDLRRVPCEIPPRARGGDLGKQLLELRAWGGAMARQWRLCRRPIALGPPAVACATAPRHRLAAGQDRRSMTRMSISS
jgi:hypothetical protein